MRSSIGLHLLALLTTSLLVAGPACTDDGSTDANHAVDDDVHNGESDATTQQDATTTPDADEGDEDAGDDEDAGGDDEQSWDDTWQTEDFDEITDWYEEHTGADDEASLETVEGQVHSQQDGELIEDIEIIWSADDNAPALTVEHDDVTVRNCRIEADGPANGIHVADGVSGVTIEQCTVDGQNAEYGTDRDDANWGNVGIVVQGVAEVVRCRVEGVRSGIRITPGSQAIENHVPELHRSAPGVSTSSMSRRGSTMEGTSELSRNLVVAGSSGGITQYADHAPVQDSTVTDNLVVGVGDGFGIYGGRTHDDDYKMQNRDIVIDDNRFHGEFGFPDVLGDGTNTAVDLERPGNTFDGNRWLGDDTDLPARCGISQDDCE